MIGQGYKIYYRNATMQAIKQQVKKEILQATESSPEIKSEIRRVFQMANRRIQNIESKNLVSPAVAALHKEDVKGFTKFSMRNDFNTLKVEYAKAVAFLRQPTSTATGTRDYNRHLMKAYDLTQDEFDIMAKKINDKITSVSDENFVEQYLMRYKDFTGELEQSASDISTQLENEANSLAKAVDATIDDASERMGVEIAGTDEAIQQILDEFDKFGI